MGTYQVYIFLNPAEGREAEFHEWYENTHLDDVLATAGMRTAQRFNVDTVIGADNANSHLAVYETDGESADEVMHRLNSTRDQRAMSDALDASAIQIWVVSPLGERHELT